MENNSPLLRAHQYGRKADHFLKWHQYDEAITCNLKAKQHIEEAMLLTRNLKVLESLQLQQQYHLKQTEIIRSQKIQHDRYKQILLNKKNSIVANMEKCKNEKRKNSKASIFPLMEDADSLLGVLLPRKDSVIGLNKKK